jgi:SAM-dependent methyltransferase
MIQACQGKFPGLEFIVADAADLSAFSDSAFDVVVFAFNGIDYVLPEQSRQACFQHIHRVLRTGGIVIFSSHNARAVLVRPSWNHERVRRVAKRFSADSKTLYWLIVAVLTSARAIVAFGRAAMSSLPRLATRIPSSVFWRGEGTLVDSVHGGLLTRYSTPGSVVAELGRLHFQLEQVLGNEYPRSNSRYATDWYYYVFAKSNER